MKIRICLGALVFPLLTLVPAIASENEFSYDEFEINNLPEAQEEESSWEFSFGIEGVYGKGQTNGIRTKAESGWWEWQEYWNGDYWEYDRVFHPGTIKREKVKLDMGGLNFRLNWKKESPFPETKLFPEIFVLGGFMAGKCEGENFWMFQCTGGGNLHLQVSDYVSVFGGVRVGLGYLLLDDASGGGFYDDSDEYATDFGLNYGIGTGIDFRLGERGGIVRLGVDYLASTTDADAGLGGLSVSKPKWVLFSLNYNATF